MTPSIGPASAGVTLTIFCDFQCPYCKKQWVIVEQLIKAYGTKLRVEWRDLTIASHPQARAAANFAREAQKQKGNAGFWNAHRLIYENQANLSTSSFKMLATRLGLNVQEVVAALQGRYDSGINDDLAMAKRLGFNGTPCMTVNETKLIGTQSYVKLKGLIDVGVKAADAKAKASAKAASDAKAKADVEAKQAQLKADAEAKLKTEELKTSTNAKTTSLDEVTPSGEDKVEPKEEEESSSIPLILGTLALGGFLLWATTRH